MLVRQLFDRESSTYTYLVADPASGKAMLVDPVLEQVDRDLALLEELGLSLEFVADTHVHADHVTAASVLVERTGAASVAGQHGAECATVRVGDGDRLRLGSLVVEVLETPGHTDCGLSYRVGNAVFTGDTLLIRGCGRTDFQNGDPRQLYRSIHAKLFSLPDDTIVYPGHDYRGLSASTVGEEKRHNPRLAGKSEEEFVQIMSGLSLARPAKIDVAVPANRSCGRAPAEAFGGAHRHPSGYFQIETDGLHDSASLRIVDVREPDEYTGELGHLPGSELVPLGTVEGAATGWDRGQPLLVVCRSGRRSARAAEQLVRMGFEQVGNLEGGMLGVRELERQLGRALHLEARAS